MPTKNILVVDDEPLLKYVIEQKFRKDILRGKYKFTFATSGFEALKKFQTDQLIDLVVTDLNMFEMDGLTLLKELKKLDENIVVIVSSAYGDDKNINAARSLGAFDFLTKPIDLQKLENTLAAVPKPS